jgi:rfaE bifunctional protein nucleotidyltransferase chain/domain
MAPLIANSQEEGDRAYMSANKGVLVYTYGAFDLLHVGHIKLLEAASNLGTRLVVGILSDEAIRARKGDDRPIQSQEDRMRIVGALACVDKVVKQETYDPTSVLEVVTPDIVTKGDDWDDLKRYLEPFIFIKFMPLNYSKEYSTSSIVETIKNATAIK